MKVICFEEDHVSPVVRCSCAKTFVAKAGQVEAACPHCHAVEVLEY
jgi:hypothetical protein